MILAVCPYCKVGKVRASREAVGASATCPSCQSFFTIADSDLKQSDAFAKPASRRRAERSQGRSSRSGAAATLPPATFDDEPFVVNESGIAEKAPVIVPLIQRERDDDIVEGAEWSYPLALVSLTLGGVALAGSQFPFGRYITLVLSVVGLMLGGLSIAAAGSQWRWPAVGSALSAIGLFLVTLFPGWLGLESWHPPEIPPDVLQSKSMPFDGGVGATIDGGWVDVSKGSWQKEDVRVTYKEGWIGKLELIGPKDKRQATKTKYIVISLTLTNVGVARRLDYRSWNEGPPEKGLPVRVTDQSGKVLAPAVFEEGWNVRGWEKGSAVFPGKSTDDWLIFEAPGDDVSFVRLELPAWAFGSKDPEDEPVRLQIPRSKISFR